MVFLGVTVMTGIDEMPLKLIREIVKEGGGTEIIQKAIWERSPIYRLLEMKIVSIREKYAEIIFPYKEMFSRIGGILHGGIIMTVLDQVGGLAALTVNDGTNQVTMELKVNFMKPLSIDNQPYRAIGEVIRSGRTTIVCISKIYDVKHDVCAVGLGTWYIIR
jgi:acyl-CoA thioesterase